jgi:hypothetical protein
MITRILAVALLAATAAPAAEAATIIRNGNRIVLTGSIQEGDDAAFAAAVDSGVRMVVLGSDGGRVTEAMAIGRLIRERHLDTAVPSSCVSACALIWAAGQRRTVNGRLAMHCPTFPGELQCYAPGQADDDCLPERDGCAGRGDRSAGGRRLNVSALRRA